MPSWNYSTGPESAGASANGSSRLESYPSLGRVADALDLYLRDARAADERSERGDSTSFLCVLSVLLCASAVNR
jgi:hypothetical protein